MLTENGIDTAKYEKYAKLGKYQENTEELCQEFFIKNGDQEIIQNVLWNIPRYELALNFEFNERKEEKNGKKPKEIGKTKEEIEKKTKEIGKTKEEIEKKTKEIGQLEEELKQKREEADKLAKKILKMFEEKKKVYENVKDEAATSADAN
ncbi:hypothetical protein niasHT_036083 [Heterodera trifolii]|uniref:Uncharacterized protein n=1 Tax=Heterodera trifolii TaxID=157864 RepID=A0ABD2I0C3_9BILA